MINTIGHDIKGSLILWLDHVLISEGRGFQNWSGNLKSIGQSNFNGIYSYASAPRQWVYDSSVIGAIVSTGVYVDGNLSGRSSNEVLDFQRGQVLFNSNIVASVSGSLSYKEVNIYNSNKSEEFLLFDKKFDDTFSFPPYTGYRPDDKCVPCIFVKQNSPSNEIIAFEQLSLNLHRFRLIFVANSEYIYQAVCNILVDKKDKNLPLFTSDQLPFNQYGDLKSGSFNYLDMSSQIQNDPNRLCRIKDVKISTFEDRVNFLINPKAVAGFLDLEIEVCKYL